MGLRELELNPRQREAVEYMASPLLVVAGAGSGKTRVLTAKIAWLLEEEGISPFALMAVTFTNKAAGEMMERVEHLSGRDAEGLTAGTFHSFCSRILRRHSEFLGFGPNFSIYDEGDQRTLIRRVRSELGLDEKVFSPGMVRSRISRAKNELEDPSEPGAFGEDWIGEGLTRAYRAYQRELKSRNAMDFDDLLVNAVRLLEGAPEVARRYQERYRYILVDEYQDTNRPQYQLVKILASHHRGLCVVGDPDQSIYGWRGADIRNILSFEEDWPDARVILLEQNYRSTQTILTAATEVITHNESRHEKKLWSDLGEGDPVHELVFLNDEEEARGISRIIQAKRRREGRSPGEAALLYRTNAQSRVLERALRGAGLNYTVVGGLRFYERAEVKDTLAYLRVLVNPRDTISLARAMGVPRRGIGDVTMGRIVSFLEGWEGDALEGLEAGAPEVGRAKNAVEAFARMMQRFRGRLEEEDIASLTRDLLKESGSFEMLRAENTVEAETRLD
ncbi:MAG: UvrD-helicase domain-containing protein, partial [bacterium]